MSFRPVNRRFSMSVRTAWRLPVADIVRGYRALWWSVGPDRELAVLLVHRRCLTRSRYVKGWVGRRVETPFTAELVVVTGREEQRTLVKDIPVRPSHLAMLPGSRLLLVSGRTFRGARGGAWEANAVVLSASGTPEGEFCIGDDITALIGDRDGGVWAAYGDEGICGDHPESAGGLAGWSTEGHATWLAQGRLPGPPLQGLTAATEGDRVWLVWYSHSGGGTFLTRITPSTGGVTGYRSPVSRPDGFAVRGGSAIFTVRSHDRRSTELVRAELDGPAWTVTSRRRLRVPGRVVLRCGQGRDGSLWLRTGGTWLRIGT